MSDDSPWGKRPTGSKQKKPQFSGLNGGFFAQFFQQEAANGKGGNGGQSGGQGGGAPGGGVFFLPALILTVALGLFLANSCFYRINPGQQAVILRFGRPDRLVGSGLHMCFPYPIENVIIRSITAVNRISSEVLFARRTDRGEHVMLTGDENLVEAHFTVLWVISDLQDYLFNARMPDETLKSLAESVVRDIVAQMPISKILAEGRGAINERAQRELQQLADQYGLGVRIQEVMMGRIDPPDPVLDAYRDVQRARADQERMVNEAEGYRHKYVFDKRAAANRLLQEAKTERAHLVARARERTYPFMQYLEQYRQNPAVMKQQMILAALEEILKNKNTVLLSSNKQKAPVLVMPGAGKPVLSTDTTDGPEVPATTDVVADAGGGV